MIGAVLAVSESILWQTQSKTQGQSLGSGETLKRKSPCLNVSPYPTDKNNCPWVFEDAGD